MSNELQDFLRYVPMLVTGSNFRDIRKNLVHHELLCGDNVDYFDAVQGYFDENYWDLHVAVYDEIDMFMISEDVPKSVRESFGNWYSSIDREDDFEFIQSCLVSLGEEDFFDYGVLSQIGDLDSEIEEWTPDEIIAIKTALTLWISSQRRKDFLLVMAEDNLDALNQLSERFV